MCIIALSQTESFFDNDYRQFIMQNNFTAITDNQWTIIQSLMDWTPPLSVAQNVLTYVQFGIPSFMFLHVVAGGLIFLQTEIFMWLELQHISGFFGGISRCIRESFKRPSPTCCKAKQNRFDPHPC
jgi:hypothetical protein